MGKFLRRLRGIIGTGLTWAIGWAVISVGMTIPFGVPLEFLGIIALSGVVRGFIAGGAFATILSIAERHHTLEDLSLRRVGLWGGIGGGLLVLLTMPLMISMGAPVLPSLVNLVTHGLTGAGFAAGSVALARREDPRLASGYDDSVLLGDGD